MKRQKYIVQLFPTTVVITEVARIAGARNVIAAAQITIERQDFEEIVDYVEKLQAGQGDTAVVNFTDVEKVRFDLQFMAMEGSGK